MLYKFGNSGTVVDTSFLKHATLWGPDSKDEAEPATEDRDEAEEYLEGPDEDLDDEHEIQAGDDTWEPDPEEYFPEEDED